MKINNRDDKGNRKAELTLSPGNTLRGRYEIQKLVYTGGMSNVYLVKDKALFERLCIIKGVREQIHSEEHRKKLEEEALRMAKLCHPNIAMILDHFVEQDHYFLVVEYIHGKSLSEVVKEHQGQINENEVVNWAVAICDVVTYIHSQGIIHRDISPDNIMLTQENSIKFIDFGTMREFRYFVASKTAGIGKFGYTPPEQWQGKPCPQSDIFAIGATIYQILTGYLPLSKSLLTGQEPQKEDYFPKFPSIKSRNPVISTCLDTILLKALQLEADKRYSSVMEMGEDLSRLRREIAVRNPVSPVTVALTDLEVKTSVMQSGSSLTPQNLQEPAKDNRSIECKVERQGVWNLSEGYSESAIRRKTLIDTLQMPSTLLPLAVCIMSAIYLLLLSPAVGLEAIVGTVTGISGVGAVVSYLIHYPKEYEKKSRELTDLLEDERKQREEDDLKRLQETLHTGFFTISSMQGNQALDDLNSEYKQLQSAFEHQRVTDPLSLSVISALTGETYRRGLSVLSEALDLMNVINTPSKEQMEREIELNENEIEVLKKNPEQAERLRLKQEIVESCQERLLNLGKLQLWVEQLLYQAHRCQDSLHSARVELATIRAGATKTSVDSVIQTLQERINQVKEVQDELTKMGY